MHCRRSLWHTWPTALQEFELSVLQRPIERVDVYIYVYGCVCHLEIKVCPCGQTNMLNKLMHAALDAKSDGTNLNKAKC